MVVRPEEGGTAKQEPLAPRREALFVSGGRHGVLESTVAPAGARIGRSTTRQALFDSYKKEERHA
jgi:hypothetical protein